MELLDTGTRQRHCRKRTFSAFLGKGVQCRKPKVGIRDSHRVANDTHSEISLLFLLYKKIIFSAIRGGSTTLLHELCGFVSF